MVPKKYSIAAVFGGWPFLDKDFDVAHLLTAVVASRTQALNLSAEKLTKTQLGLLLAPSTGREVRRMLGCKLSIKHKALTIFERNKVDAAKNFISRARPDWKQLFEVPIIYIRLLSSPAISCSCLSYPQHVFLSGHALKSPAELQEQILHELSHNYLYLLQELWRFHDGAFKQTFTLPSGTDNRDPTEVLGAGTVAAILLNWYRNGSTAKQRHARIKYLEGYLCGCVKILNSINSLSWMGAELRQRLNLIRA